MILIVVFLNSKTLIKNNYISIEFFELLIFLCLLEFRIKKRKFVRIQICKQPFEPCWQIVTVLQGEQALNHLGDGSSLHSLKIVRAITDDITPIIN